MAHSRQARQEENRENIFKQDFYKTLIALSQCTNFLCHSLGHMS